MRDQTWVYHRTEPPQIVDSCEAHKYYALGWANTPAAFTNPPTETKGEINVEVKVETREVTNETREIRPGKGKRVLGK